MSLTLNTMALFSPNQYIFLIISLCCGVSQPLDHFKAKPPESFGVRRDSPPDTVDRRIISPAPFPG